MEEGPSSNLVPMCPAVNSGTACGEADVMRARSLIGTATGGPSLTMEDRSLSAFPITTPWSLAVSAARVVEDPSLSSELHFRSFLLFLFFGLQLLTSAVIIMILWNLVTLFSLAADASPVALIQPSGEESQALALREVTVDKCSPSSPDGYGVTTATRGILLIRQLADVETESSRNAGRSWK